MSVRVETYVIYGVSIDRKEYNKLWNQWDEDDSLDDRELNFPYKGKDAVGMIRILNDCYGNDYCIAGKCLAIQDDEYRQSFGLFEVPTNLSHLDIEISDWLYEKGLSHIINGDNTLYVITHYC